MSSRHCMGVLFAGDLDKLPSNSQPFRRFSGVESRIGFDENPQSKSCSEILSNQFYETGEVEMMAKRLTFTFMIAWIAFTCGSYFVFAQPPTNLTTHEYGPSDPSLAQNSSIDLNTCQRECRMRFGYEPLSEVEEHFRRGSGAGSYYEYANCIAGCNAQFWKEFDNNMRNLERMR